MENSHDSLYGLDSEDEPLSKVENDDKITSLPESPGSSLSGAVSVHKNDSNPRGEGTSSYTSVKLHGVEEDSRNVRQLLEAKDAVLEPGLAHTIADFIQSGGGTLFHGAHYHAVIDFVSA